MTEATDYLLLVIDDERAQAARTPSEIAAALARRTRFVDALRASGALRDHGRFRPSGEGRRVRRRDGATVVEPLAPEAALAEYLWIAAATLADAERIAREVPLQASERVELRTLMKGIAVPDKVARPGKLFGFGVLGAGADERAWTAVMDRIDAETQTSFPASAFAGGNRLQPPPRRAMVDGPYLESKEIIGGVFFLRMMAIEDAIRWAAASRFVVHGALEIRELWR